MQTRYRRAIIREPLSGEPPARFKIFDYGENPGLDGCKALVERSDVDKILAGYSKLGRLLPGKVEHGERDPSTLFRFALDRAKDGEDGAIYADVAEWTPGGIERWRSWQSSYITPSFWTDKQEHVTFIGHVGLTDDPVSFNAVSVHQRSIQGMPLLSDALMAVAPEGAYSCDATTDGRVVYYLETGSWDTNDYDERTVVMGYTLNADGTVTLDGKPLETDTAFVVVEPAEDAPVIPVITSFELSERPEAIEIERAVVPVMERAMIDTGAIEAKFPGAVVAGVVLTMPDGTAANVDLQGNPLAPVAAPAPAAPPAVTDAAMPPAPPAQVDPAVMRAVVAEEIQRAISALKPEIPTAVVQPEKIEQPASGVRTVSVSGPVDRSMRR